MTQFALSHNHPDLLNFIVGVDPLAGVSRAVARKVDEEMVQLAKTAKELEVGITIHSLNCASCDEWCRDVSQMEQFLKVHPYSHRVIITGPMTVNGQPSDLDVSLIIVSEPKPLEPGSCH